MCLRAGAAKRLGPEREFEGQSAGGAAGRAEEGDSAPALGAERPRGAHLAAAGKAARRQQQIQNRCGAASKRAGADEARHRPRCERRASPLSTSSAGLPALDPRAPAGELASRGHPSSQPRFRARPPDEAARARGSRQRGSRDRSRDGQAARSRRSGSRRQASPVDVAGLAARRTAWTHAGRGTSKNKDEPQFAGDDHRRRGPTSRGTLCSCHPKRKWVKTHLHAKRAWGRRSCRGEPGCFSA
jgi:hypothetical protein